MKNIVLYLLLLSLAQKNILAQGLVRAAKKKISVEKFSLVPFVEVVKKDSIKIVTFIEIPYSSLQFVKKNNSYIAYYQASISLKDDSGQNYLNKVWMDSMNVKNYTDTRSFIKNAKHFIGLNVPIGKNYEIIGELQDLDTRKKGFLRRKIESKKYNKRPKLVKPIFLLDLEGNWGFDKGKIPTKGYKVRDVGLGVDIKISGFLNKESYSFKLLLKNQKSTDSLLCLIEGDGSQGFFNHSIFIDAKELTNLRNEFTFLLKQGSKSIEEKVFFSLYKPGVSNFVGDLNLALKQMKYLLSVEEVKELKKKKSTDKEHYFFELWEKRDPTPLTENNELMDEYFKRISYTNEHFDGWQPGWETDRGMIYILFGPPDEIRRSNSNSSLNNSYQVWYYNNVNKQFSFKDQNGFGDYRLEDPFIGSSF